MSARQLRALLAAGLIMMTVHVRHAPKPVTGADLASHHAD